MLSCSALTPKVPEPMRDDGLWKRPGFRVLGREFGAGAHIPRCWKYLGTFSRPTWLLWPIQIHSTNTWIRLTFFKHPILTNDGEALKTYPLKGNPLLVSC